MSARRSSLRLGATALLAGAAFALSTASASAGILVASTPSCGDQAVSKVFSLWHDDADYTPLPGGDFEGAEDGWSMTGSAATADGNSPYHVGGPEDSKSLSLPAGSSATSAPICVGIQHPTFRFFVRRRSGGWLSLSMLRVEVLFHDAWGGIGSLPVGLVLNDGSWQPTLPIPVVANLLTLGSHEDIAVRFRFTALGEAWSVDDVWVDPYHRR
ncbi:MAG TPA: hypothetical protein VF526_13260 [Solirubrobacteraceae bacterium]